MIMPMEITFGRFLLRLLSERGSFDRTADKASRGLAQRPTEQIVAILREKADWRYTPPGIGALGPMTDTCVHLRDAARPLGLETSPPLLDWRLALDFLVSPTARRGFVPRGRLDGLTLGNQRPGVDRGRRSARRRAERGSRAGDRRADRCAGGPHRRRRRSTS